MTAIAWFRTEQIDFRPMQCALTADQIIRRERHTFIATQQRVLDFLAQCCQRCAAADFRLFKLTQFVADLSGIYAFKLTSSARWTRSLIDLSGHCHAVSLVQRHNIGGRSRHHPMHFFQPVLACDCMHQRMYCWIRRQNGNKVNEERLISDKTNFFANADDSTIPITSNGMKMIASRVGFLSAVAHSN
jgi:hypothetical protein